MRHMRLSIFIPLLLMLQLIPNNVVRAETVRENLPNGLEGNAEYLPVNQGKPAVIVLHGFLQTYNFLATQNIVNSISEQGYTVLAPNLSLGVPSRKQSVQCNAAHTHTTDGDIEEIDFWIGWLKNKGYRSVILVGHSWGSQHSLVYKINRPESPVIGIIAISLVRTHESLEVQKKQIQLAKSRAQRDKKSLHAYQIGFCKEYMATPESYISYAKWNDQKVINTLSELKNSNVPVYVILGEDDRRIDFDWIDSMKSNSEKTVTIKGANHFFSHNSAFDLYDELNYILPEISE